MKHKLSFSIFALFTTLLFSEISEAQNSQNWIQFRGINRNATIEKKLTDTLPEFIWKKNIGSGFSEVLVQGDMIFTMTSEKIDSTSGWEFLVAYNTLNGEELWKTKVDSIFIDVDSFGDGPRSTPCIDNENIYCFSSYGKLMALTLNEGKILWTVDFIKEFESSLPRWAFSSSPILLENALVIETGGSNMRGFASINKNTGETKWIKGLAHPYYCSPTIAIIDNKTQLIFANDTMLTSYDKEGNVLWEYRMPLRFPTATPLFISPNKIFVSSVSNTGSFMVKVEGESITQVFKSPAMKNHFSSSVYYDGYIYGFSNATLRCISAENGETKWSKRGLGKGSLINVGKKLLVLSDKGVLKIVEAIPDMYTEKSSTQALKGKSWTAPSYANGIVYMRNLEEMAAYKLN